MKRRIISLLKDNGGFVSGESLSDELGITRSAVWKHINSLREEGYVIESVRNKGYCLVSEPEGLDEERIKGLIGSSVIGSRLVYLKSVDSTNEEVKRLARTEGEHGLVVVSDRQTSGRGRFSRKWVSESGGGLYFSILLRPDLPPSDIASITLSAGYAVCLAIRGGRDDHFSAVNLENASVIMLSSEYRLRDFRPARPHQACQSEYFSPVKLK